MVKPACGAGVSHAPPTVMPNVDPSIISCSLEFFFLRFHHPLVRWVKRLNRLIFASNFWQKTMVRQSKDSFGHVRLEGNSTWIGVNWIESIQWTPCFRFWNLYKWSVFDTCQRVLWNSSCLARIWETNFWRYCKLKVQCFVMLLGFWGSRLTD